MNLRFWKPKKQNKVQLPEMPLLKRKGFRTHGASQEFTKLDSQHKDLALRIYKPIIQKKELLANGEEFTDKQTGAKIKQTHTGSQKGDWNKGVYSVSIKGKTFFIKTGHYQTILRNYEGLLKAKNALGNKKFNGFNVQIITPHLIYSNSKTGEGILVSDFFDSTEVTTLKDLKSTTRAENSKKIKLLKTISKIRKFLDKYYVWDVTAYNSFYHHQTNSILLFDING